MVEWGRLLSGYRGEILGRRFESCPPRHKKTRSLRSAFLFGRRSPQGDDIRLLSSPPQENAFPEERVYVLNINPADPARG